MATRKYHRKSNKGFRKTRSKRQRGGTINADLINAAYDGNLDKVKDALNAGAEVNVPNNGRSKYTALSFAIMKGHIKIVELLIDNGANVNTVDNKGNTVLHLASTNGQIVQLLIDKGADVNAKNNNGETALLRAFKKRHIETMEETMELLIRNKATIPEGDEYQELREKQKCIFQNKKEGVLACLRKGVPGDAANVVGNFLGGKINSRRSNINSNEDHEDPALISVDEEEEEEDEDEERQMGMFKENLKNVINICLSNAEQIESDLDTDYDSDSDSGSEANIPITKMNDEQLKEIAVCNELVYGDYNTEHIGYLQQSRDLGVIRRLTYTTKQEILQSTDTLLMDWFDDQKINASTQLQKFYKYVVIDIYSKLQTAFGIRGGKRKTIKKRKTKKSIKKTKMKKNKKYKKHS